MPKKKEDDLISIPTELLDMDAVALSENDDAINQIIEYLKQTRVNVRQAEATGQRISKSTAKKVPKKFDKNPLDMLLSET
jgi:hypothetical protein